MTPGGSRIRWAGCPAFHGGSRDEVNRVMSDAVARGWRPLYGDRYPHAGGPDHYAGWLENSEGFKVEIVATRM